jgi:hypothetical protein
MDGEAIDVIPVDGMSSSRLQLEGLHGDEATVAQILHAATVICYLEPGLRLPIEIPAWTGISYPITAQMKPEVPN